jgi:hypothetical protein
MLDDYTAGKVTGPGGHRGNDSDSCVTDMGSSGPFR